MLQRKLVVLVAAALWLGGMNASLAADPAADKRAADKKAAEQKAAQDKMLKQAPAVPPPDSVDKAAATGGAGAGSATGGAGAGKVKFNEFTIKKTTDTATPTAADVKVDPSDPSKKTRGN